jgi:catechol 2,3-dioxygenase-like lactoylglutathione lyase family enzyme
MLAADGGVRMRGGVLFGSGILVGVMLMQLGAAQGNGVRTLNHVGMVVKNYEAAFDFYTKTMGFREAYTIKNDDGSVRLTYLQLNKNTFVELIPAGPNQSTGITHFGVEVGDLAGTVATLRRRGATIDDPARTPSQALFARMKDPEGTQIEVMEFTPESLQRKAIDAWR